jgi:NADH-quinone oxidoreductase subunit H
MNPTVEFLGIALLKIALLVFIILTAAANVVWLERRLLGWIQKRLGPNRVGPFGLLQSAADGLKFIFKEDIVPSDVNRFLYMLAPMIAVVPALMTFAVIPFGPEMTIFGRTTGLYVTAFNVSLLYIFALTSIGVYGIVIGGWSSNSKYSLLGSLRSSAQMVSYELAIGLSVVGVLIQAGTVDLTEIVRAQADYYAFGSHNSWFGIPHWFVFWGQPLGFIIFLIAAMAETNRVPFDLPEAETELVAGFHTEYSSMKFAMFFIAEYANMITASALATTLFFGGWSGPGVHAAGPVFGPLLGVAYFAAKVFVFLFIYIWVRGTLPRFRYDQLMDFGWKLLLPLAIINIVVTATLKLVFSLNPQWLEFTR